MPRIFPPSSPSASTKTPYSRASLPLTATFPGSVVVARVNLPGLAPVAVVSVYGVINVYATTTMLRVAADLMPLFDSADGRRVILGGDLNVSTAARGPEVPRYRAVFEVLESLGLQDLHRVAKERPTPVPGCPCDSPNDCYHVQTHRHSSVVGTDRESLPGHNDYLFASPELARCCTRLWLDDDPSIWELSDHCPVLAEFELPEKPVERDWDERSFVEEIRERFGASTASTAETAMNWAERRGLRIAFLPGVEGQWWAQLDEAPKGLQYTFSMRTKGDVVIQFQYWTPPYDDPARKEAMRKRLNAIPGIRIEKDRLGRRPSFPLKVLEDRTHLVRFLEVFDELVSQTRAAT